MLRKIKKQYVMFMYIYWLDYVLLYRQRQTVRAALPGDLADRAAGDEAGRHPAEAPAGEARQDPDPHLQGDREGRAQPLGAL